MLHRIIPLRDARGIASDDAATVTTAAPPSGPLLDRRARPLRDLRISVTDRCNFRCVYCMPKATFGPHHAFLPHDALLTFEEIERLARLFVGFGVDKIRLTGGEPLLRRDLPTLVERLARLSTPDGRPPDLTLTTNGVLLARHARALKNAGLARVTVSLDALDDALFRRINDADFPVASVLAGIDAAQSAGLAPLKINMVVKRGLNDGEILPLARRFRGTGAVLRFIEYMDVGATNDWRLADVVPSAEVVARIAHEFPLVPAGPHRPGETAQRWRYADGGGEIGTISSVTRPFCGNCTRARLSTDGRVYHCLFAGHGYDLRAPLRGGATDAQLAGTIARLWLARDDRYSELRSAGAADGAEPHVEMSFIGG